MQSPVLRWLGAALLVLGLGLNSATASPKPATAASVASAAPVPLLWKVSGDAGSQLYLLGSFHMLKPSDYPVSVDVDTAFEQANALVFELAPEEANSPALAMQMMQAALRTDGRQLKDDLDPALSRTLEAHASRYNMPLERLQGFKPWFVGLTISVAQMARNGLDPALGLDRHLMQRAGQAGKPATGLETAASQLQALDQMTLDEQRQLLAEALDHDDKEMSVDQRMHSAWRAGDAAALWEQMGEPMRRDYPQLYQRINVDRNQAWLPLLQPHLQGSDKRTLVVVGALHLLGPDGLVEQLRGRGYRVERVCSSCAPVKTAKR